MKEMLQKLKNPTVLISVLSQIGAILILMGVDLNENMVMSLIGMVVSILATLGIVSKSDTKPPELESACLTCTNTGTQELHVKINGQMTCVKCGAICDTPESSTTAIS